MKANPVKKKRSVKGKKADMTSKEQGEGGRGVPARKSPSPRPPQLISRGSPSSVSQSVMRRQQNDQ